MPGNPGIFLLHLSGICHPEKVWSTYRITHITSSFKISGMNTVKHITGNRFPSEIPA